MWWYTLLIPVSGGCISRIKSSTRLDDRARPIPSQKKEKREGGREKGGREG
jgi:hypothetical protein